MPAFEQLQREDSTSVTSEVTLSSVGPHTSTKLGIPVAGVVYVTVHFTWASNEHSAPHFKSARSDSTIFLGKVSPLIFKSCGWHLPVYRVALRSMSGFGDNVSSPQSILSDTLSLTNSSEAANLKNSRST